MDTEKMKAISHYYFSNRERGFHLIYVCTAEFDSTLRKPTVLGQ